MIESREMPELVTRRWLRDYGLTPADADRVMRSIRPVLRAPGGRTVYARREDVERVLRESESFVE